MEDLERERKSVTPPKPRFDESKLTPTQRRALEIAKAQGVKPIKSLEDLRLDVEPKLVDELIDTVLANRQKNRHQLKSPF